MATDDNSGNSGSGFAFSPKSGTVRRTSTDATPRSVGAPPSSHAYTPPPSTSYAPRPLDRPTPEELAAAEDDRRRSRNMLIGAGCVGAVVLVIGTIGFIKSFATATKVPEKHGALENIAYGQTKQRMLLLVNALNIEQGEAGGTYRLDPAVAERHGLGAKAFQDKWGNTFRIADTRLISSGADGKPDTDDDMWFDIPGLQQGGYFPDVSNAVKAMREVPATAKAAEMVEDVRRKQAALLNQQRQFEGEFDQGGGGTTEPVDTAPSEDDPNKLTVLPGEEPVEE